MLESAGKSLQLLDRLHGATFDGLTIRGRFARGFVTLTPAAKSRTFHPLRAISSARRSTFFMTCRKSLKFAWEMREGYVAILLERCAERPRAGRLLYKVASVSEFAFRDNTGDRILRLFHQPMLQKIPCDRALLADAEIRALSTVYCRAAALFTEEAQS